MTSRGDIPGLLKCGKGLSLIELVVTMTILGILAAGVIPLNRMSAQRTKEIELRRNLRTIRAAIDDYKKTYDTSPIGKAGTAGNVSNRTGYPKNLDELLKKEHEFGDVKPTIKPFLRRKIYDPFHPPESESDESWGWNLRCAKDKPDSNIWCKDDVFDVYSMSEGISFDGKTKYSDW